MERVNPAELAPPSGFSHAVVARGTVVFLAGQTATDGDGRVVAGDLVAQFDRALGNLLAALAAASGSPADLAKLTVYCTDPADYGAHLKELGTVWRARAGRDYPAMTLIGVTRLVDPAARVEIDGLAVLPETG